MSTRIKRGLNDRTATQLYQERVKLVREMPGLAAFWDFVQREDGIHGSGRFLSHAAPGDGRRYLLEPRNISRDFWNDGPEATMADFPLLGRGPFGQAVGFRNPRNVNQLPVLLLPRTSLHDTPIDAKGPGMSVSMIVWMTYKQGAHAIAGLWHEGTDSPPKGDTPVILVPGQRQYGLFAGLGANPGAASAHVSENGLASFGDTYAHHLAVTREKIQTSPMEDREGVHEAWTTVGLVYDNALKTVTAYANGITSVCWVENPANDPFYTSTERAWRHARGGPVYEGEAMVPQNQHYVPPEDKLLSEHIIAKDHETCTVLRTFEFTKVKVLLSKDASGHFTQVESETLAGLKVNPYYFGHDLYSPPNAKDGAPFTIGRVIHSNRESTLSADIGGVAVFSRPLSPDEMTKLAQIGHPINRTHINGP